MMAYGRNEASDALKSIAGGTASFESRAKLEHHLLRLLRRRESPVTRVRLNGDLGVILDADVHRRGVRFETWESMLGLGDSEVHGLDARRRAVFYVGLLEAEVMNGGLGQYLSNTEGAHVDATLRCLAEIGAPRTAAILAEAARLGATAESYTAAWDSHGRAFERLDREFLESGEDLAGLTSDAFSGTGRGD